MVVQSYTPTHVHRWQQLCTLQTEMYPSTTRLHRAPLICPTSLRKYCYSARKIERAPLMDYNTLLFLSDAGTNCDGLVEVLVLSLHSDQSFIAECLQPP